MILLRVIISCFSHLDSMTNACMGLLVNVICFSGRTFQLSKNKAKTSIFFTAMFFFYIFSFLTKTGVLPF